ncbi:MAG TPA: phosphatase PAP2 family protein [Candidatus Binatia bacterium]|nr:phosphatase PAP2 family protein [Candidatus Binatia bacterium]
MQPVLRPSDLLTIFFLAMLSGLAVFSAPANPAWAGLFATYAALVVAVLAAAAYRTRVGAAKKGFYLSVVITVMTVSIVFNSLGELIASIHATTFDDFLIAVDHSMFGVHPTVWMERWIRPTLSALLQFAYISYYFIPLSLGVVLIAKGRFGAFEEVLFGILLCFYLSYVGYLLVPAIGPRFTLSHLQTGDLQLYPLIETIQGALNALEKNKTDAFPSGHTAVSLMCLYYAWKEREKKLFAVFVPVVTGLLISTVYLRYHYVIDVIAGIALTGLTIALAAGLQRLLAMEPAIRAMKKSAPGRPRDDKTSCQDDS